MLVANVNDSLDVPPGERHIAILRRVKMQHWCVFLWFYCPFTGCIFAREQNISTAIIVNKPCLAHVVGGARINGHKPQRP